MEGIFKVHVLGVEPEVWEKDWVGLRLARAHTYLEIQCREWHICPRCWYRYMTHILLPKLLPFATAIPAPLLIILPTEAGKSLLFLVPASLPSARVTVGLGMGKEPRRYGENTVLGLRNWPGRKPTWKSNAENGAFVRDATGGGID